MPNDPLTAFRQWLAEPENGIFIHPSLDFIRNVDRSGHRVITKTRIEGDTILMKMPKSSLLSIKNSALSNLFDDSLEEMVALSIAYLYERNCSDSPWKAYLDQCPRRVQITKLWTRDEQELLVGTEVETLGGLSLRDLKDFYKSVKSFIKRNSGVLGRFTISFEEFSDAMSVIGSRAFETDWYHGIALCPFADSLDHDVFENVHFQTDVEVCDQCGSRDRCEHVEEGTNDDEEMSHDEDSDNHVDEEMNSDEEETCEFIALRTIEPGNEILNTYGTCSNALLLSRYGFSLPSNPHDRVFFFEDLILDRRIDQKLFWCVWDSIHPPEEIEEDEERDITDYGYITSDHFQDEFIGFVLLSTKEGSDEVKMKVDYEMMIAAWRYVQPGRMPLPRFMFDTCIIRILGLVKRLTKTLQERERQYKVVLSSEEIERMIRESKVGEKEYYALLARRSEQSLLDATLLYLSFIQNACSWLLEHYSRPSMISATLS